MGWGRPGRVWLGLVRSGWVRLGRVRLARVGSYGCAVKWSGIGNAIGDAMGFGVPKLCVLRSVAARFIPFRGSTWCAGGLSGAFRPSALVALPATRPIPVGAWRTPPITCDGSTHATGGRRNSFGNGSPVAHGCVNSWWQPRRVVPARCLRTATSTRSATPATRTPPRHVSFLPV